tara:strand:- start:692 stop:937 length:246 start_codon:yes stop_codon:yes gene_type:complete
VEKHLTPEETPFPSSGAREIAPGGFFPLDVSGYPRGATDGGGEGGGRFMDGACAGAAGRGGREVDGWRVVVVPSVWYEVPH